MRTSATDCTPLHPSATGVPQRLQGQTLHAFSPFGYLEKATTTEKHFKTWAMLFLKMESVRTFSLDMPSLLLGEERSSQQTNPAGSKTSALGFRNPQDSHFLPVCECLNAPSEGSHRPSCVGSVLPCKGILGAQL